MRARRACAPRALSVWDLTRRRFLFAAWGAEEVEYWTAAQKMSFNGEHYAGLRDAVEAKLEADALDYIAGLEIA